MPAVVVVEMPEHGRVVERAKDDADGESEGGGQAAGGQN